jgi:hypothetical protein
LSEKGFSQFLSRGPWAISGFRRSVGSRGRRRTLLRGRRGLAATRTAQWIQHSCRAPLLRFVSHGTASLSHSAEQWPAMQMQTTRWHRCHATVSMLYQSHYHHSGYSNFSPAFHRLNTPLFSTTTLTGMVSATVSMEVARGRHCISGVASQPVCPNQDSGLYKDAIASVIQGLLRQDVSRFPHGFSIRSYKKDV